MKKSCKFLCFMLIVFMMTGCMKFQTDMKINKDKSMDFTLTYAIANSLVEQAKQAATSNNENLDNESLKELEKQGFKTEEYSDSSMTGIKLSKTFNNIDDISSEKEVDFDLEAIMNGSEQTDMFTIKKGFFKNTYTLKIKNNTSEEVESDITNNNLTSDNQIDFSSDMDLSMLSSSMDMTFNINLPYKAISSNATSTENDGKNLKWNLLDTNIQNITAKFELYNMNNIYLTIGIVIVLIIIVIIIIKRKPKAPVGTPITVNDKPVNNITQNPEPVAPIINKTPNQTVAEMNNGQTLNTNINSQPVNTVSVNPKENINNNIKPVENNETVNNINPTPDNPSNVNQNNAYAVETLDVDTLIPTPNQQVISTPAVPPMQESEVETLDINSESQTPMQPSTNNTFLDEKNNIS